MPVSDNFSSDTKSASHLPARSSRSVHGRNVRRSRVGAHRNSIFAGSEMGYDESNDVDESQLILTELLTIPLLQFAIVLLDLYLSFLTCSTLWTTLIHKFNYVYYYHMDMLKESATDRKPSSLTPIWRSVAIGKHDGRETQVVGELFEEGYVLVTIGCSLVLFSIVINVIYLFYNSPTVFSVHALCLVVGSLFLVLGSARCSRVSHSCIKKIKSKLLTEFYTHYTAVPGNSATAFFDRIMIVHDCCGIRSANDFWNLSLIESYRDEENVYADVVLGVLAADIPNPHINFNQSIPIAPACCEDSVFSSFNVTLRFLNAVQCTTDRYYTRINRKGCFLSFVERKIESMQFAFFSQWIMCLLLVATVGLHVNTAFLLKSKKCYRTASGAEICVRASDKPRTTMESESFSIDRVKGSTVDKVKGNSIDKVKGNSVDKVEDNSVDKVKDNSVDKVEDNSVDKVKDNRVNKVLDDSVDKVKKNSIDKVKKNSIDKVKKNSVDKGKEKSVGKVLVDTDNKGLVEPQSKNIALLHDKASNIKHITAFDMSRKKVSDVAHTRGTDMPRSQIPDTKHITATGRPHEKVSDMPSSNKVPDMIHTKGRDTPASKGTDMTRSKGMDKTRSKSIASPTELNYTDG